MRNTLLASAALLGMAMAMPAFAQSAADPAATTQDGASPAAAPQDGASPAATTQDGASPAATTGDQNAAMKPATHHHRMRSAATTGDSGQWAHQPGTGESGPASAQASNIDGADTHSAIAPHLPRPMVGENAGPDGYLRAADRALAAHKTGAAQQALEMAETRLLDRSTAPDAASRPDQNPRIAAVAAARQDLATKNWAGARASIQQAMAGAGDAAMPAGAAMAAPSGAGTGQMQNGMTTTSSSTSNVTVAAPDSGHDAADGHPGINPAPLAGSNGGSMGAAGVNAPGAPYVPNPADPGNEAK
jgi:hypothetical protein